MKKRTFRGRKKTAFIAAAVVVTTGCAAAGGIFVGAQGSVYAENSASAYAGLTEVTPDEGWYTLSSAAKNDIVLDVSGASADNGANIQVYTANSTDAQKFYLEKVSGNEYVIKTKTADNKVVDVSNGNANRGANVWQYEYNATSAQKWKIYKTTDNKYVFKSQTGDKCLDICGANASAGVNVWTWDYYGARTQQWDLNLIEKKNTSTVDVGDTDPNKSLKSESVKEGWYTVSSAANSNMALDVSGGSPTDGANIQIYTKNSSEAQKFYFDDLGNGEYRILTGIGEGNFAVDVNAANPNSGTNVQQWSSNSSTAQKWKIYKTTDGKYVFKSLAGDKCLDICGANASTGTNIWTWDYYGAKTQQWELAETTSPNPYDSLEKTTLQTGYYTLKSKANQNVVLDVASASSVNGANVQVWSGNNSRAQVFYIKDAGEGKYTIETISDGRKVVDVYGANVANGTNIQQYDSNGSNAQKWEVYKDTDGNYVFKSSLSKQCLDICGANASAGTNVWTWNYYGADTQKWVLSAVNAENVQVLPDGAYTIASKMNTRYAVDVANVSDSNGAKLQLWEKNGASNQIFQVKYVGDGLYTIKTGISVYGKAVDIPSANAYAGASLQQYDSNGTDAQKYRIVRTGDDSYAIKASIGGNLALDVSGGAASNGASICLSVQTDGDASEDFVFTKADAWLIKNARKYYFNPNGNAPEIGVDVSHHQGRINWEAVKNDGISFAIIRVKDSISSGNDRQFSYNVSECERLGIPYGVYIYSRATTDAQAQREVNDLMNGVRGHSPALGVFLDIEDTPTYSNYLGTTNLTTPNSRNFLTNITLNLINKIRQVDSNIPIGIYANQTYFNSYLYRNRLAGYDLWVARYYTNRASDTNIINDYKNYRYWQYASENVRVNGISGNIDVNTRIY